MQLIKQNHLLKQRCYSQISVIYLSAIGMSNDQITIKWKQKWSTYFVYLTVCSIAYHFDEFENSCRILQNNNCQ